MKTKEQLLEFEREVKQMFLDGKLRSPVHLSGGNEDQLIEIFKNIKQQDWIFTTYRSHYHALLKGVPEERLRQWVLDNKSIHFMDSEYKVFSSAIVGGCLPIALGVAMAIKRKEEAVLKAAVQAIPADMELKSVDLTNREHVYIFVGDMTASTGVFHDCYEYAYWNNLPITFIIEDNGMSTDTVTKEAWGRQNSEWDWEDLDKIIYYQYTRTYPHYGVGAFVKF